MSLTLRSYADEPTAHSHTFHQLVLPCCGSMDMEVDGRGGRVDGWQGAFVAAGGRHAFSAEPESRFFVIDIGSEQLDALCGGVPFPLKRRIFFPIRSEVRHLIDYAARMAPNGLGTGRLADAWAELLFSSLTTEHRRVKQERRQQVLTRAVAFMERALDRAITIGEVACNAGISERRLYVLFREELGCTPYAYLANLRLDRAVELLGETMLPIDEIARLTGYADQSALTRALRRVRNTTPSAWRRIVRGAKG